MIPANVRTVARHSATALAFILGQWGCAAHHDVGAKSTIPQTERSRPGSATPKSAEPSSENDVDEGAPAPDAADEAAGPSRAPGGDATKAPRRMSLADASAACERLQKDREIPATCTTDYVDDVPSMLVGFPSPQVANTWLVPFAEQVGGPFCEAAVSSGREARIYVSVGLGAEQRIRRWSCERGEWGEWHAAVPPANAPPRGAAQAPASQPPPAAVEPAPPQTIAGAIELCSQVQANRSVPVSCMTTYFKGLPTMIVGFPTQHEADAYLAPIAEKVAGPFCDAANRVSRRAGLLITVGNTHARPFDCERQSWGEWFELPQAKPPAPAPAPARGFGGRRTIRS